MINNNLTAYVFLFLIAIFMLGANPFKSETIAPMDLLVKYPGWKNTNIQLEYINGERSDVLDSKLPIWISAKKTLYNGELPIWNHQRAGKPGLTFTNSLFTPAFIIFAIIKDDALGFYLSNLINILIGLFGMYMFLRIFLNPSSSAFGAFIFMFSGFHAAWFFWAHVDTTIWTPWVLLSVCKYLHTQDKKYLPLITLSMLMLNLGGFPMVAVMTYMSLAIMVFIFYFTSKYTLLHYLKLLSAVAIFSIISAMMALPFIYPLVELLSWMGGIDYRHAGSGFKMSEFALFINPDLYRYPRVETTFYVGILPVIFFFIALVRLIKKPTFILVFSMSLFVYSLTIAFTLIGPDIIHQIPTLNSSLLTRFGYLIGFSLAIIAAYTFHLFINRFQNTKWIWIVIILLFTMQIFDQRNLFQQFNGSVPNKAFYPKTKTISYLQENLKPFQYVMADRGFLIAGTLGGYNLNDWFAHSFHTGAEKEILTKIVKNPFQTPTSAIFSFEDINLSSPYIDYLNIKSILSTSLSKYNYIHLWDNERTQTPAPIFSTNELTQKFTLTKEIQINGIALLMATYGEVHASSDVALILKKGSKTLGTALAKKQTIQDNKWVTFKFKTLQTLQKGTYNVSLKILDKTNIKPLTVWTNTEKIVHQLLVNNEPVNMSLKMALTQKKTLEAKYSLIDLEPYIYILENNNVTGGAYFINELDTNQSVQHAKVKTTLLSNTEIEVAYTGSESGWIILPMRSYPGWEATVNGKNVQMEKFLGMLPAIQVNGKSKIIISYNPSYNTYTYLIAILGLLLLLFSMYIFRKREPYETYHPNTLL